MNDGDVFNSKRWERLRGAVLIRDQFIDQVQKRYGRRVQANTVHHIFPREYFPQFTFCEWNLISVSHKTHNQLHDRETHKLTNKGFEILKRTARKQGIQIDDHLIDVIVEHNVK